jgi:hypothetical protein
MAKMTLNIGAGLLLAMLAGCHSTPHSAAGAPSSTVLPDSRVVVDPPIVTFDHSDFIISGTLHRNPYVGGLLAGRIDCEFVSSDDEVLDELPITITPRNIPANSSAAATYYARYSYIPAKGYTLKLLRLHFVDAETQAREDLEGGGFEYAGGAARGAGHEGAAVHTGHAAGMNTQGGFGSNFGVYNFAPNGGRH